MIMPVCSICETHNESTIAGRVFFLLIANQVSIVSNKVSELDIVVDLITKYHKNSCTPFQCLCTVTKCTYLSSSVGFEMVSL